MLTGYVKGRYTKMHWMTMKIPIVKTEIPITEPIQWTSGLLAQAVEESVFVTNAG